MNSIQLGYCPVCSMPLEQPATTEGHSTNVHCKKCGSFLITSTCRAILGSPHDASSLLNSELKKSSVGHWLRHQQFNDMKPQLTSDVAERLAANPRFPSLRDQLQFLLRNIGDTASAPGERVNFNSNEDQYIVGARTPAGIEPLMTQLETENLLIYGPRTSIELGDYYVSLTFNGWLEYEEIKQGKSTGRQAFLAMPFNKEDLDIGWVPVLKIAVKETGFDLRRVDDEPKPGLIDIRMRMLIKESRFLIVELTHANLGAYWEAGFAEGLGKPVIYTCREGEAAHFDVDHLTRIEWNPDNLDVAADKLKATIRNALPDAVPEKI